MRHGSLFSGIGGFDLAAQWMGWENVFQVEIDGYCQRVLQKNFPNVKRYGDIREFDGTQYKGQVDIISGGFPCQPFSVAGKRKGTEDERALWPQMLRTIREVQPSYVVAENVSGLLTISGGLVFEQVCADLESEGYEVQPVIIPAASKNALHKRERIWFVAHSSKLRCDTGWTQQPLSRVGANGKERFFADSDRFGNNRTKGTTSDIRQQQDTQQAGSGRAVQTDRLSDERTFTHTKSTGLYERPEIDGRKEHEQKGRGIWNHTSTSSKWITSNSERERLQEQWDSGEFRSNPTVPSTRGRVEPGFRGGINGFSSRVDRIKGLGNAIVPQIAFEIFKAIEKSQGKLELKTA